MTHITTQLEDTCFFITLNRPDKGNAFSIEMIHALNEAFTKANTNPEIRVVVIRSNGKHFCAGACLNWMKSTAQMSYQDNYDDAMALSRMLKNLHELNKPTIALTHGAIYGGGLGIVAACDIVLASKNARFCFSEVKLGLIPAVISPYIISSIGLKVAKRLFLTAEVFSAEQALCWQLIDAIVESKENLDSALKYYTKQLTSNAPNAMSEMKSLALELANQKLSPTERMSLTAMKIANCRISEEAQHGMQSFLNKTMPRWKQSDEN